MHMCGTRPSCLIFMELVFSGQIFEKALKYILYFMNIRADGQT